MQLFLTVNIVYFIHLRFWPLGGVMLIFFTHLNNFCVINAGRQPSRWNQNKSLSKRGGERAMDIDIS